MLHLIAGWLIALASFLSPPSLGVALPQGPAVFETSLQSRISATDTSLTLVSTTTASGEILLPGYHCFTLDEGRTDAEFVCGTLSAGKSVTGLERGLSYDNGTSTVTANEHAHRVGANVKVTDYPLIQRLRNQANGIENYPNLLRYDTTVLISGSSGTSTLATKYYVDNVAVAGAPDSSLTTKGNVEKATGAEAAATAADGSGNTTAPLVLTASIATGTPTVNGNYIPVTRSSDSKLSPQLIATTSADTYNFGGSVSVGATTTLSATTSIAASGAKPLVLNTATTTWNISNGIASSTLTVVSKTATSTDFQLVLPDGVLLASTTLTGAVATTTLPIPSTVGTDLHVVIEIPSTSGGSGIQLQFNADTNGNYAWGASKDGASQINGASVQNIVLSADTSGATNGYFFNLAVTNQSSFRKYVTWTGQAMGSGSGTISSTYVGGGLWNNTSSKISSISIGAGLAGAALAVGTRISIYSSAK